MRACARLQQIHEAGASLPFIAVHLKEIHIMATKEQLEAARQETIAREVERQVAARMAQLGAAVAPGVKEHVANVQPEAAAADIGSLFENLPSPSRVIVGFVLALAAAGATGYGVGTVMSMALAGVATFTGSALLGFCMTALVWILGIYAGWKLSAWAGRAVFTSIVLPEGLVSRCCASLSLGAQGIKEAVVDSAAQTGVAQRVAQFTGAWQKQPVTDVVGTPVPAAA
jgi:hypothetical protein